MYARNKEVWIVVTEIPLQHKLMLSIPGKTAIKIRLGLPVLSGKEKCINQFKNVSRILQHTRLTI